MRRRIEWLVLTLVVGCSGPTDTKSDDMVVVITNNDMMCPACADGEVCVDGFCQVEGCVPVCEGSACAPNGCGGMCNPCEGRESCIDGTCELAPMDCSGFAAEPQMWTLPSLFEDDQFEHAAGSTSKCGSNMGSVTHQLLDLKGDGTPDLVLTDKCDGGGVGTLRWEVFENSGTGFASEPTTWTLPSLFEDDQFESAAGSTSKCGSGSGTVTHQLMDLDGDGKLDLVLTDRCDTGGVGTLRWEVFENTGSGFAAEPTTWTLPALFEDDQFDVAGGTSSKCGTMSGSVSHALLDLTADGKPDLVLTDRCDSGGVGTTRWEVFENTGSGFAASPTEWSLPSVFEDEQFEYVAENSGKCGSGSGTINHLVMDLDGDGKLELVLTDKCDSGGVGTTRWEVFANTGSGFAAESTSWTIPALFEDEQFEYVAESASKCGSNDGVVTHQLMDMDADGLADLLLTDRCDSGGVGTIRWEYYRNQGNGFAAESTEWTLPSLFEDDQFERVADSTSNCGSGMGMVSHLVMDLDGDGSMELVLTDRCDSGGVGTMRWDTYTASCE